MEIYHLATLNASPMPGPRGQAIEKHSLQANQINGTSTWRGYNAINFHRSPRTTQIGSNINLATAGATSAGYHHLIIRRDPYLKYHSPGSRCVRSPFLFAHCNKVVGSHPPPQKRRHEKVCIWLAF
jgi:hypothetical protein